MLSAPQLTPGATQLCTMLPSGKGNSRAHWKLSFWFLGFVSKGENSTAVSVSLLQDTQRQDRQRGHRSNITANIRRDVNSKEVLYNILYNICAGDICIYLQIDRYGQHSIRKTFPELICYLAFNNSLPNEKYNYQDTPAEELQLLAKFKVQLPCCKSIKCVCSKQWKSTDVTSVLSAEYGFPSF